MMTNDAGPMILKENTNIYHNDEEESITSEKESERKQKKIDELNNIIDSKNKEIKEVKKN